MSKARQLADLGNVYDDGALSNRNLIINGAMQVAQRGTSFGAGDGYTLDRFICVNHTSASQSSSSPSGFQNSIEVTGTNVLVRQLIENSYFRLSASTFTVSFYIKGNSAYSGTVDINDGTQQSFSVTTSWQRIVKTFNALTSPNAIYGNDNDFLDIQVPDTSATWQLTGVQLEIGDTATPFEHRSYGDELARCLRYFQKSSNATPPTQNSFGGSQISVMSGQDPQITEYLSPPMRAQPAVTLYSSHGSGTSGQWFGAAFGSSFSSNARAFGIDAYKIVIDNTDVGASATGWCEIGWTADAEL